MKKIMLATLLLWGNSGFSESTAKPHAEAKESKETNEEKPLLDFSSIKDLIKKDGLEGQLEKKDSSAKNKSKQEKITDIKKYDIPNEDVFWGFFSELWLVKNATTLKWDFQKPDFDLENALRDLLQSQGHFEKKFKILLIDTPDLVHAALPSKDNEYIFLVSYPFIKSLDLSKVEIALLMFEDYLRLRKGYLRSYVESKELKLLLGSNFKDKPIPKGLLTSHLKKYNEKLFTKGFTFQEQFEVTMEMGSLLKSNSTMWNTYYNLIDKIDIFVKDNALYKKYSQIYPSPELQKNWLKPNKTRM